MKITISAFSDKGIIRERNEDIIIIDNEVYRDYLIQNEFDTEELARPLLIGVADGLGGHNGGEIASEYVSRNISNVISKINFKSDFDNISKQISKSINEIHQSLLSKSRSELQLNGMGSTFTGLIFINNIIYLIHVGDTRCYRFRKGFLAQITLDHSLSEMTGSSAVANNLIVNSFGAGEKFFHDFEDISNRFMNGDAILLCSDGLYSEINNEDLENALNNNVNTELLINSAKDNGGKDNISVITINIDNYQMGI